ncbi:hypothetical protein GV054_02145 [Marinomonas mediterranea]|uniref:hypothetical protein n=1 Tax=Marinomonas mediterranea TaxID=119864 RepID=UPI00234B62CC|nr:hypothetical protein [Marinomonas mediterranea]WCN11900.1 hypothetical protein GV054_02145 [Marinomonas mediterranea]
MLHSMFNKMLLKMQRRYDYDVRYQQDILNTGLGVFLKFMGFQSMASHAGKLPTEVLYAARIRAIIWDDCGPCTQLVVSMALEEKVEADLVRAIVDRDLENMPAHIALVVRFTEFVMAHNPEADDLREEIRSLWGENGLITIAFAISSYRVYPALKYALGYGKTCSRVTINDTAIPPGRA